MDVINITDQPDGGAIIEIEMTTEERDSLLEWAILRILTDQVDKFKGIAPKPDSE